jgi:molybdate transport system substrate-binding protein
MNPCSLCRWRRFDATALFIAALLLWPLAAVAQVKVIISGGFSGPYEKVLPEFERTTGIKVTTGSGSSQGTGPQTIASQLASGAAFDLVILSREGLEDLMKAGRIAAGTDVDLARTPLGVAVRAGAPKPDVSTVAAFKQVLLNARSVAVPSSTSGIYMTQDLLPRLGIADQVRMKRTPRGAGAPAMVVSGEADIAVLPVSEILHAPGVELAGVIAEEIQLNQIFAAAVVAGSSEVEPAKRLIAFLASDAAAAAIRQGGMEPLGKSR